jgi:hypothetical protein
MRGRQSPGAGRITAPGKVSGSRRFYVINPGYRLERWSGGAVATATAYAPKPPFQRRGANGSVGKLSFVPPRLVRPRSANTRCSTDHSQPPKS